MCVGDAQSEGRGEIPADLARDVQLPTIACCLGGIGGHVQIESGVVDQYLLIPLLQVKKRCIDPQSVIEQLAAHAGLERVDEFRLDDARAEAVVEIGVESATFEAMRIACVSRNVREPVLSD